jgi:hypothetical protein
MDAKLARRMARDTKDLARELAWPAIAGKTVEVYRRVLGAGP